MNLTINGKLKMHDQTVMTIQSLLESEKVAMPDMVSVQLNGAFVLRERFTGTVLKEGDQVDFLYFMGGGAV